MVPDQRVDVLREISPHEQRKLIPELTPELRSQAEKLLQYPDNSAAGIMTTEFVSLDPAMTAGQALAYLRATARNYETIYACWVIDPATKHLLGVVSLRDLVMADENRLLKDVMHPKPITVQALDDRTQVAEKISRYNLLAVPVLDAEGRVLGNVTVDDIIDVMIEKQTEDVLRLGAVEPSALDQPYLEMPFWTMVKKRAGWLVILFLGEMLTATAMGHFEAEIEKAVVLALFVPLIISSGGNSGSQASTIVIRAMALKEVRLGDWWTIMRREIYSGLALGGILGTIGFLRIAVWSAFSTIYGEHWPLVALTVGFSLVGVVLWGTLSGSLLPLVLRRLGFDPATSSAPFVATLVDVTGLVIYFSVALVFLRGTIL
jgi:magnesium transporter